MLANIEDTKVFHAPYAAVWSAVVASVSEQGYPIQVIEKDSGIITTQFVQFTRGFAAKDAIDEIAKRPSVFLGTWNGGRYSLSVYATAVDSATSSVKITPHIEGFENNLTNNWHVCGSKGVLEARVFQAIASKL